MGDGMKMQEIADRINKHIERFEYSLTINEKDKEEYHPYYCSSVVYGAGRYISITYVAYQGSTNLTKADATEYLKWLDKGNVGKHFKALSFNARTGK